MKDLSGKQSQLMDEIEKAMDKYGVDKAVILVADPDKDDYLHYSRGDILWRIGALKALLHQNLCRWELPSCAGCEGTSWGETE